MTESPGIAVLSPHVTVNTLLAAGASSARSFTSWRHDHCALHSYSQLQRRFERNGFDVHFADIPVVTAFFRRKLRHYLGAIAPLALAIGNPDRLPLPMRTNFYLVARKRG